MLALYTNPSGQEVTQASYSQRESFRFCPRQYELRYSKGWKRKEVNASTRFGKALEAAIQTYEENRRVPTSGPDLFQQQWERVKLLKEFDRLTYTDTEGNWESLLRAGCEMMMLYEIHAPNLPIVHPKFQVPLKKQIFPGSELAVLTNKAYLDMLSFPKPNEPMIIDIKTAGSDLDADLIRLDPQLAEYAWQLQVSDVAFLWFVKRGHSLKKGDSVSALKPMGGFPAGSGWLVLGVDKESSGVFLGTAGALQKLEESIKNLRGKALEAEKAAFFSSVLAFQASTDELTKQRLQFVAVRLTEEEIRETGQRVGFDTVQMVEAHRIGVYPKTGSIRWPNQKCNFCEMRGICLSRPDLRDSLLTREGEEWLDGDEN